MISKDPEKAALQRQRISEAAKERNKRSEWRARQSEAGKKRCSDPEERKKMSERTKEVMARPGARERARESILARYADPEWYAFYKERQLEGIRSPESRAHISEAQRKRLRTPETEAIRLEAAGTPQARAKHREAQNKRWTRPEEREKHAQIMSIVNRALGSSKTSSIEMAIANLLDALEVEYEPQKPIGRYVIDFYLPHKNLVVEVDGEYWHQRPGVPEKDARRDAFLREKGYNVLRIPGQKIQKNDLADFIEMITS
jgi:very-short-patch-repair endonuclease